MMRSALHFVLVLTLGTATNAVGASEISGGPVAIIACPTKAKLTQTIDLSTGVVPWIAEGPGLPIQGKAMATPLEAMHIPVGWSARLSGAQWVQALPASEPAPHAQGPFLFSLSFDVKKGKRMPKLSLTGEVTADEVFDLNLIEPSAANAHISSGVAYGDDTPGEVAQEDVQPVSITESGGLGGKPLGQRAGRYQLNILVENGTTANSALGLLAKLSLNVKCGAK